MKSSKWLFITLLMAFALATCQTKETDERESIFDGKAFIAEELITDIPQVSRLCDELELKKHRIYVGGGEVYCDEEGRGIPIVLIHGGPGATHHYFHPHFSRARNFARVIYYDQRGCGISDHARGEGYSMDKAVDDLERIRKALEVEKWVVLGHSFGGMLAQYYATKHPENLLGLVLVGSALGMHASLQPSRQWDYITEEERERMRGIRSELAEYRKQNEISEEKALEILVFNNHLNGDWKRQNFYRPSVESLARMARYEWKHDPHYRSDMAGSMSIIDLEGAFEGFPIPTLILEGLWDLTWNTDKPGILHQNHPNSDLVMFERSSHSPFEDEPENFFKVLKGFVSRLPEVSQTEIEEWKNYLVGWKDHLEKSPKFLLRTTDHTRSSYEKIAGLYSVEWLKQVEDGQTLNTAGYALYEMKRYEEALQVFKRTGDLLIDDRRLSLSMIWQGHMLDLLGRRDDAIDVYKKVAEMKDNSSWQFDQYGLRFESSPYAEKRIEEPFRRVENQYQK